MLLDILKVTSQTVRQVSLAETIAGERKLNKLKTWWDNLISKGKKIGYYVHESRSWLILNESELLDHARTIFHNTGIKLTCEGKWLLGVVNGSDDFKTKYVSEKSS